MNSLVYAVNRFTIHFSLINHIQIQDVEPDDDCHKLFCESPEGKRYCDAGQVRALHIQESESLGPYAARYFASKLWGGEQWYG